VLHEHEHEHVGTEGALGGSGRAWRLLVTVIALGCLAYGTVRGAEKMFPAGPMTQYAFYISPNGSVDSITVWADTSVGTHVPVELNAHGVGIKRADIEIQLPRIERDPSRLQAIADAQRRLHPAQPGFTTLYVVDTGVRLHDRVPGAKTSRVLVTWLVRP
jgi:hypothetical protein